MNGKPTKKQKIEMDQRIKTAEKGKDIFTSWEQHMTDRDEIESFTTIVADKMYNIKAKEGETLLPFSEYHGDHTENWIILINNKTKKEILRKNTRTVDMINWKLSSPSNNSKKDGK